MGLLQTDDRVRSIVKNERANYRKMKYEFNKKRHFMGSSVIGNDQYKEEEQVSLMIRAKLRIHSVLAELSLCITTFVNQ